MFIKGWKCKKGGKKFNEFTRQTLFMHRLRLNMERFDATSCIKKICNFSIGSGKSRHLQIELPNDFSTSNPFHQRLHGNEPGGLMWRQGKGWIACTLFPLKIAMSWSVFNQRNDCTDSNLGKWKSLACTLPAERLRADHSLLHRSTKNKLLTNTRMLPLLFYLSLRHI